MPIEPIDEPLNVQPVEGEVVILGPDGMSGSMTPDAAETSGSSMIAAAQVARTQPTGPTDDDLVA